MGAFQDKRFNSFMANVPAGEHQAGADILGFKPRIPLKDRLACVSSRKHVEHMLNGKPPAAYDRFPAENLWVYGDPAKQIYFVHESDSLNGV